MIRAIRTAVGHAEAVDILKSASPISAEVERRLFYPFRFVSLRCSTRTLLGESAMRVACLVDARTRLCATADPFELEELAASHDEILEATLDELDSRRIAERYVAYVVRRRRKALANPKLEVLESVLVYKPFWIVGCSEGNSRQFRVLVDGVTGGFHPIPDQGSRAEASDSPEHERDSESPAQSVPPGKRFFDEHHEREDRHPQEIHDAEREGDGHERPAASEAVQTMGEPDAKRPATAMPPVGEQITYRGAAVAKAGALERRELKQAGGDQDRASSSAR